MKCTKCGREAQYNPPAEMPGFTVIDMRSHDEAEKWAWYCKKCKTGFCGQCAFPKWQALKAKEGLTGSELARKLNQDPGAVFSEMPTCPTCRGELSGKPPPGKCFIATAACGSDQKDEVVVLQEFRERYLKRCLLGRVAIGLYETLSPPVAAAIAQRPLLRWLVRTCVVQPAARALTCLTGISRDHR